MNIMDRCIVIHPGEGRGAIVRAWRFAFVAARCVGSNTWGTF